MLFKFMMKSPVTNAKIRRDLLGVTREAHIFNSEMFNAIKENNSILTKPICDESALLIDSCDVPSLHTRLHDAGIYSLITPAAMENVI